MYHIIIADQGISVRDTWCGFQNKNDNYSDNNNKTKTTEEQ